MTENSSQSDSSYAVAHSRNAPETGYRARENTAPKAVDELATQVERWIYVAVAVVLVLLAVAMLGAGILAFVDGAVAGNARDGALRLLDSVLLVLMIVELLHTVRISIREDVLVPGPFLIVGLIAAVRRILIITAEQATPTAAQEIGFRLAMLELGLLTLLIIGLVCGIIALSRWSHPAVNSFVSDMGQHNEKQHMSQDS
jgi:uncharacterized membrane protein (DUF373 family)